MKGITVLIAASIGAVIYVLVSKTKQLAKGGEAIKQGSQTDFQVRGVLDPNYPNTAIWAADQKVNMGSNTFWNTLTGWLGNVLSAGNIPTGGQRRDTGNPLPVWTPPNVGVMQSLDQPNGSKSGITLPASCKEPTGANIGCSPVNAVAGVYVRKLSAYFWAADKVPVNPNMQGSDADPNLAIKWTVV